MKARYWIMAALSLLFFSCEQAVGPAGPAGPTVYLTDGATRVYSGGEVYAGMIPSWSTRPSATLSTSLRLVNASSAAIRLNEVAGKVVRPASGYAHGVYGVPIYFSAWEGMECNYLMLSSNLTAGTVAANSTSAAFSIGFQAQILDTFSPYYPMINYGTYRQRYEIEIEEEDGDTYDFAFTVYGIVAC